MGMQEAQQVNAQLPIIQDPEINRYLNVLGDSLARVTSRADLDWHFYLVNSNDFKAFNSPRNCRESMKSPRFTTRVGTDGKRMV